MNFSSVSGVGTGAALWAALLAGCSDSPANNGPMDAAATDSAEPSDQVDAADTPTAPGVLGARCALGATGGCLTGLSCEAVTGDSARFGICTRTCSPLRDPPQCVAAGEAGRSWSCSLTLAASPPGLRCVARCGPTVTVACPTGTTCRTDSDNDGTPDLCVPPANAGDGGTPPVDVPAPVDPPYVRGVCSVSGGAYRLCLGTMFIGEAMNTISAGVESPATSFVSIPAGSQRSSFEVQSVRPNCLDISSSRVSFPARAGAAYTVFGGQVAGGPPQLINDQAPPPAGSVRLRAFSNAMGTWAAGLDVCSSEGAVLLAGVSRASNPTAVIPPQPSGVVVKVAATPACSGATVGRLSMAAAADRAYSLFFVANLSDSALLSVWCPDPVPGVSAADLHCASARLRP